jgi:V/A-type H+/Na+-transporting ATPase subunit K
MDPQTMMAWGKAGGAAALGLAAIGSSIGAGLAGAAAIGAWKKCYAQSKAAPFILITFIGAPLSQTIYGMILMGWMVEAAKTAELAAGGWATMLVGGICGGMGMAASAWFQGKAGAAGADALAETGQGFGNYLMTLGVIETVALFVLVFIRSSFT